MKKILLTIAVTVLAVAGVKAQTVVDIGGSTAGRTAVHSNILTMLGANCTYAYTDTSDVSASKATYAIYHGTYNSKEYTIRTYWSGSVNGITPLTAGTQQTNFIDTSVTGQIGGIYVASPAMAAASAETVQEIGFADIFASTVHQTATTVEDEVAVITFKWFANQGSTGITNMTPSLVRNLYKAGDAKKSLFTGNPADTTPVYAFGRNSDSGTRATAMAESGYGTVATVVQYLATSITNDAVDGIDYAAEEGNGGYSSGSSVKNVMNAAYSGGTLIGYLGASDFATGGGIALTWNGVPWSAENIQNGLYTFWGYLHMNRMTLTGDKLDFYNGLKTSISATPVDTGVMTVGSMNVARDADGAPVYKK